MLIQKQIALLAVLIAAGLLIISNLELGDETTTKNGVVIVEGESIAEPNASGGTSQTDAWELTDISSPGSGFGFTDSTLPASKPSPEISSQSVSFGESSITPSSTTPTSSSLFYSEPTTNEKYLEPESEEAEHETFSLALPSVTQ